MNAQSGTFSVLSCTLSAPFTYVLRVQWLRVLNPLLRLREPKALPRREAVGQATTPAPTTAAPMTPPAPRRQYESIAHVRAGGTLMISISTVAHWVLGNFGFYLA